MGREGRISVIDPFEIRRIAMKTLALSTLYVFSIVLAIGIAMGQAGKESQIQVDGTRADCKIRRTEPNCTLMSCGKYDNPQTMLNSGWPYLSAHEVSTADHVKQCYSLTDPACNTSQNLKRQRIWITTGCDE